MWGQRPLHSQTRTTSQSGTRKTHPLKHKDDLWRCEIQSALQPTFVEYIAVQNDPYQMILTKCPLIVSIHACRVIDNYTDFYICRSYCPGWSPGWEQALDSCWHKREWYSSRWTDGSAAGSSYELPSYQYADSESIQSRTGLWKIFKFVCFINVSFLPSVSAAW